MTILLSKYRKQLNMLLGKLLHVRCQIDEEREILSDCEEHLINCEEALQIIQQLALTVQQDAHKKISHVVSKCIESIFPVDPYKFKIIFERKRGQTEARMVFLRKKFGVWREVVPKDASGGGCVDVASFALRLSCLALSRPRARKVEILDEPFKNISPEYRHLIPNMLLILSEEMGIQFIMVTNFPEYETGEVIKIKSKESRTE